VLFLGSDIEDSEKEMKSSHTLKRIWPTADAPDVFTALVNRKVEALFWCLFQFLNFGESPRNLEWEVGAAHIMNETMNPHSRSCMT
jgi:hypothetical protein